MTGRARECTRPWTGKSVRKAREGLPAGNQRAPVAGLEASLQLRREWRADLLITYNGRRKKDEEVYLIRIATYEDIFLVHAPMAEVGPLSHPLHPCSCLVPLIPPGQE